MILKFCLITGLKKCAAFVKVIFCTVQNDMADLQNLHFIFCFDNDKYKCTFTTRIISMVMVQNSEVISDKFIMLGICTS